MRRTGVRERLKCVASADLLPREPALSLMMHVVPLRVWQTAWRPGGQMTLARGLVQRALQRLDIGASRSLTFLPRVTSQWPRWTGDSSSRTTEKSTTTRSFDFNWSGRAANSAGEATQKFSFRRARRGAWKLPLQSRLVYSHSVYGIKLSTCLAWRVII